MSKIEKADIAAAEEILEAMDHNFEFRIRWLFENAGKIREFSNGTPAEFEEKQKIIESILPNHPTMLYTTLKLTDLFTKVARRSADKISLTEDNEAAFAKCIKSGPKLTQDHIDLLKRYQCDSLAAILEHA